MACGPESDRPVGWCCLLFAVWSWASFLTSPTLPFPHSINRTEDQSSTEGTGERGAVQTRKTATRPVFILVVCAPKLNGSLTCS